MIICKSPEEISLVREAGRIVARAMEAVRKSLRPKLRTSELDRLVENLITKSGGRPAFKGYNGFPASICVSINDEVVHGIPGDRRLSAGDIISIDIGVEFNGYFADAASTFPVGEISVQASELINAARRSLGTGISAALIGRHLSDISHAIQTEAETSGFSVVRDYVGHGIGRAMHEEPQIPNFGLPGKGPILKEGMVFALEPMLNIGGHEVEVMPDQWTVRTADRSLSAHFEHTVVVTAIGPRILTSLNGD